MRIIYLIGEPGIGKTTLMTAFTDRLGPAEPRRKPFAHRMGDDWLELGERRGMFSGTDALSMSVAPRAIEWLRDEHPASLVLGEGDRLGTRSFFDQVSTFADLRIVALVAPPAVAAVRRAERAQPFMFNPRWLKGRITKVERLLPRASLLLNAELPVNELVEMMEVGVYR